MNLTPTVTRTGGAPLDQPCTTCGCARLIHNSEGCRQCGIVCRAFK